MVEYRETIGEAWRDKVGSHIAVFKVIVLRPIRKKMFEPFLFFAAELS